MAVDDPAIGLQSPEELREVVLSQRRDLDALRRENEDVAVLIDALDGLLQLGDDDDPFAGVFAILERVFSFTEAVVVAEDAGPGSALTCIVATDPHQVGLRWPRERLFEKVLGGRVTATVTDQPALYLPLGARDRRALMRLTRAVGEPGFDRRDIALARKFALLASHALAARAANRLARRANHDPLTGLPNRTYFAEHVTRTLDGAGDRTIALAFIDLDGFKQVNDLYGHTSGDALLMAVADRIRDLIRSTDVLARISGDEFVLLVDPVESRAGLNAIVERLLAGLKEAFDIDGHTLLLSASIGVALYPDHGSTYAELRRNADTAMYHAKTTTKGSAAYFDAELGREASARTELEQVLRRAVRERRFRSVLQPIVDLRTLEVVGFEALARRVDDEGRLSPSAAFIGLADQLGLLDAISSIVIDDVLASLPALDAAFGPHTTVSLNVSAGQATDPATMRALLERLAATGAPSRFVLELTEDAFLSAGVFQAEIVPLVERYGVRASIDDFGTGYASLSTLLNITAHELKIDRMFVTDIHERARSQTLMEALAAATSKLGITVVAEGVETADELAYLRACTPVDLAQGYLFARPTPVEQLVAERAEIEARLRALRGGVAARAA